MHFLHAYRGKRKEGHGDSPFGWGKELKKKSAEKKGNFFKRRTYDKRRENKVGLSKIEVVKREKESKTTRGGLKYEKEDPTRSSTGRIAICFRKKRRGTTPGWLSGEGERVLKPLPPQKARR